MTAPLLTLTPFQRDVIADAALGLVSYRHPWVLHYGVVLDEDHAQQVRALIFAGLLTRDGSYITPTAREEGLR